MVGMIRGAIGDSIALLSMVALFIIALWAAPLVGVPYSYETEYEVKK